MQQMKEIVVASRKQKNYNDWKRDNSLIRSLGKQSDYFENEDCVSGTFFKG
jgi:hypothetical protein